MSMTFAVYGFDRKKGKQYALGKNFIDLPFIPQFHPSTQAVLVGSLAILVHFNREPKNILKTRPKVGSPLLVFYKEHRN